MLQYRKIRKSVVQQQDRADCGVACLQSVLCYYEQYISLEQLRNWSGTQRSGTTMLGMVQAAESAGLQAVGYSGDLSSLQQCTDVCILHVLIDEQFAHYFVYWGYDEEICKYIIGDPATGTIEAYSSTELDVLWKSKFLLVIKPGSTPDGSLENKKPSLESWLYQFIRTDFNLLGMALILGILVAVLGLSTAIFSQKLLDNILPSGDRFKLFSGVVLLTVLLLFRSALGFIRQSFLLSQARNFNIRTLNHFIHTLLSLPKSFFDNRRTGDLVARMNDTSRIQVAITQISANALIDVLIILATVGTAFCYQWQIGLILFSWLPLYGWITWRYYNHIITGQRGVMQAYALTESTFVDTVQAAGTIKLFNRENLFASLVGHVYTNYQNKAFVMGKQVMKFGLWTEVAGAVFISVVLLTSAFFTLQGNMTIGMIIAVLQMASLVVGSAARLNLTSIQLQEARVAFDRMHEFTSLQPEYYPETDTQLARIGDFQELCTTELAFQFPGRESLLERVSLTVRQGELVALWGETGSGKSTLLQILQKFYAPTDGAVEVNGINLAQVSTSSWRNCLGVVEQEITIFDGSIADNIVLGTASSDPQLLVDFLSQYGFDTYFARFPQGISTLVGKEGISLSGGQKQLLGLARALWKKPQLLLLDEPTAALDQETEQFVLSVLQIMKRHAGILLLTHRKEVEHLADRLYQIKDQSTVCLTSQCTVLETVCKN